MDAGKPAAQRVLDDMPANVAAATACGLSAFQFTTPSALRMLLRALGLLSR